MPRNPICQLWEVVCDSQLLGRGLLVDSPPHLSAQTSAHQTVEGGGTTERLRAGGWWWWRVLPVNTGGVRPLAANGRATMGVCWTLLCDVQYTYHISTSFSSHDATEFTPPGSINTNGEKKRTRNDCAVSMLSYLYSVVVEGKEQLGRTGNTADSWPSREIEEEII